MIAEVPSPQQKHWPMQAGHHENDFPSLQHCFRDDQWQSGLLVLPAFMSTIVQITVLITGAC